jgi:hypothetical protein
MWKKCLLIFCMSVSAHAVLLRKENPVTFIDGRTGNMHSPLITCSPNGDAMLFVTTYSQHPQKPNQRETLYVAFKEGDNLWSEPQVLRQAEEISSVKAAVDIAGPISFCWIEDHDKKRHIYYGQKSKGDFWVAPFCFDFKGNRIDLLPQGEIICTGGTDDMGNVVQTNKLIKHQFFNICPSETDAYYVPWSNSISFNQQGEAVAIQKGSRWRDNTHWVTASWYQNSQWTSPQIIHQSSSPQYNYQTFRGNDLTVIYYWEKNKNLHLLTFWDGQTSSHEFPKGHAVALGPNDEIYVVGQSQENCLDLFFQDTHRKWHSFSLPLLSPGTIENVCVKVDAHGNCLVVWACWNKVLKNLHLTAKSDLYGAVFSVTKQQWSTPILLSPLQFSCHNVSVSLADKGHGFLAWIVSNGKDQGVQVAEISYDD